MLCRLFAPYDQEYMYGGLLNLHSIIIIVYELSWAVPDSKVDTRQPDHHSSQVSSVSTLSTAVLSSRDPTVTPTTLATLTSCLDFLQPIYLTRPPPRPQCALLERFHIAVAASRGRDENGSSFVTHDL